MEETWFKWMVSRNHNDLELETIEYPLKVFTLIAASYLWNWVEQAVEKKKEATKIKVIPKNN